MKSIIIKQSFKVQILNWYIKQGFLIKVLHIYIFNYNRRPKFALTRIVYLSYIYKCIILRYSGGRSMGSLWDREKLIPITNWF